MYEKFGEFDSAAELNQAAAAQKAEGDREALMLLAKENGIDPEDAEDFWDGTVAELCTPVTAALGKIEAEAGEIDIFGAFKNWKDLITIEITSNPAFAGAVRRKGKSLIGAFAAVLKQESEKRRNIDKKLLAAAGLPTNRDIPMSTLTAKDQRRLLIEYYMEVTI